MRLNAYTKQKIINSALKAIFQKRAYDLEVQQAELFLEVVESLLPDNFKKSKDTYPRWFPLCKEIVIPIKSGTTVKYYYIRREVGIAVPNLLLCPDRQQSINLESHPTTFKLNLKAFRIFNAKLRLADDMNECREKLSAVVKKCSTVKKLKEVWPEVEQYYQFPKPIEITPEIENDLQLLIEGFRKGA